MNAVVKCGLQNRRIVITGGCGFIGSALVRHLVSEAGATVLNLDKLTYAGSLSTVASVVHLPNYRFARVDICNAPDVNAAIREFQPDAIFHLAAESHVDRSIDGPAEFIRTNIIGTYTLLEAALSYFRQLPEEQRNLFRFLHVSTDEVYGALTRGDEPFTEESKHRPNSPYSASKASADHLARAWWYTYGLPVIVSNCSNNYGPYQFPEKMIPTIVLSALERRPLPVYGTGENIRDWLFVNDHVGALAQLLITGKPGETYLVGGGAELRNIDLVQQICAVLDELRPESTQFPHSQLIRFVPDRPGHDLRYAVDTSKIRNEVGWRPEEDFASGLRRTVQWYLDNEVWWRERLAGNAVGQRLGLAVNAPSEHCGAALHDQWRIAAGE
jgi:dTDP-glucose 4,6-dehydratase